jgi:DNA adenine methylase
VEGGSSKVNTTLFPWIGGKFYLLEHLYPLPTHDVFIDVFGGSGVVSLNYKGSGRVVYNDINSRVVNFYKCLAKDPEFLMKLCYTKGLLDSKELFKEYQATVDNLMEDAARYFYVGQHSYRGLQDTFHEIEIDRKRHEVFLNKVKMLKAFWRTVKTWQIENIDYKDLIKRCQKQPNTLMYLDPPYSIGTEYYDRMPGNPQKPFDINEMVEALIDCQCKVMISYDDLEPLEPLVDLGYSVQKIKRVQRANVAKGKGKEEVAEYILRNFKTTRKIDEFMED